LVDAKVKNALKRYVKDYHTDMTAFIRDLVVNVLIEKNYLKKEGVIEENE